MINGSSISKLPLRPAPFLPTMLNVMVFAISSLP
jgi:hypothetical protein